MGQTSEACIEIGIARSSSPLRPILLGWAVGGPQDQRCVIGFPGVGSEYWTAETLRGVEERYGGAIDMKPYAQAAGLPRL